MQTPSAKSQCKLPAQTPSANSQHKLPAQTPGTPGTNSQHELLARTPMPDRIHVVTASDNLRTYNLNAEPAIIFWVMKRSFTASGWWDRVVGPSGIGPAMSTPYQPTRDHDMENTSTSAQPPTHLTPLTVPDVEIQLHRPPQEIRQGYRPVAPIQCFNNKSLNWPAWFRHFRAVADVHGWSKDQRALQLVSYLDKTAMNVAQELGDSELYNYDFLAKLLSDRFDPASRVSAFRTAGPGSAWTTAG